jgi:undecaprenyl-diphosphatase
MSYKVKQILLPLLLGAIIITLMILEKCNVFDGFDESITRFIVNHRGSKYNALYYIVRILTELGNFYVFILLFILFGFYFKWDYRIWYMLIIGVITIGLNFSIKLIVSRPRPLEAYRWMKETSASFPSSHSAMAMVVYLNLYILGKFSIKNNNLRKIIMILSIIFIIIVGLTRIILAVHYTTDVLGGFLVGIFTTLLGYYIYLKNKLNKIEGEN